MILSAGIIIVRRVRGEWRCLILRAYTYWDFPKGEVEAGETPFTAAVREVREETGLYDLVFPWGEIFKETEPYNNGRKKARYYLARTDRETVTFSVNPLLGRPEHHEYRWADFAGAKQLLPARLTPILEWARKVVESREIRPPHPSLSAARLPGLGEDPDFTP
ncbi:MAG: NUDIX domain-containing protein [Desulfobulbaceae bacterium]|nr:NUDIX domain-containing protein [Desulfobulbaceae bacterium]